MNNKLLQIAKDAIYEELSGEKLTDRYKLDDVLDLKNKIRVGIDGVILKLNSNQATFLPSVWQQLPTFELFFSHLCQKARLNQDCLKLHPKIFTYEAIKIK